MAVVHDYGLLFTEYYWLSTISYYLIVRPNILGRMKRDEDALNPWSQSAPYWEQHRETIRGMFAPITLALIQDARIAKGQTVLDVATGPGEPALTIAEVVGSSGRVAGIDPVAEMIAAAERAA